MTTTSAFNIGDTVRIGKGKTEWTVRGEVRADGTIWLTSFDARGCIGNRYVEVTRIEGIES